MVYPDRNLEGRSQMYMTSLAPSSKPWYYAFTLYLNSQLDKATTVKLSSRIALQNPAESSLELHFLPTMDIGLG